MLSLKLKAGFGSGQIAGQIFRDTPSLLLLFYLTNIVGIAPAIAGAAIFFPKVFGGVASDLTVGLAADKLNSRFPRRKWLLVGGFLAPTAMVLLFHAPQGSSVAFRVAYVMVVFAFYMAAFATFSVPYLAQFSEITRDSRQRTVLLAWRHAFTGVGLLIGSALTPAMIQYFGAGRDAYAKWSWGLAAICAASLFTAYNSAPRIVSEPTKGPGFSLRTLLSVMRYRPYRILLGVAFSQTCGAGMSYAGIAYFVSYNMKRADALAQIGLITLIMGVVVIAGSPIWVYVSRRLGKKRTYVMAAGLHAVVQGAWALSAAAPMGLIYGYAALIGLLNAGWGIMSLSMLSDIIARAKLDTGQDQAGSFAALWALAEKIGIALGGALIAGLILSASGFTAAKAIGGTLPPHALGGIALVFGFGPSLINLGASLTFWRVGRSVDDKSAAAPALIDETLRVET